MNKNVAYLLKKCNLSLKKERTVIPQRKTCTIQIKALSLRNFNVVTQNK